jgi:hypothetical protein
VCSDNIVVLWYVGVSNLKVGGGAMFISREFTRAHPTNLEHNMAFSVVDRLCDKGPQYVYIDRWFSSSKIFTCLWSCKTKAQCCQMEKKCVHEHFLDRMKKYHANGITS